VPRWLSSSDAEQLKVAYFSEREGDLPPQTQDGVPPGFVQAIVSMLSGLCKRGWLARGWPRVCPDDPHPIIGADEEAFWSEALATLNFESSTPRELVNESQPLRILNLIEFTHRHVALPIHGSHHAHFSHYHLDFNGPQGKDEFRQDVNGLFARFGLAFRLEPEGQVVRLTAPVLDTIIGVGFTTGDVELDEMLEDAIRKFKSPDPNLRRDGLERLWDAFERLKTIEIFGNKQTSADKLLTSASNKGEIKRILEDEFRALTSMGNAFRIRHHETDKVSIDTVPDVDYLFHRMFAVVWRVLKATGRV
jgi:hypothetical protein